MRVLLVGTVTLDLVFGLEHHPAADEEMRAASLRTCRGGNAANTAVVLARLGHAPEFLGVLADAPETAVIERDFAMHGVAYGRCPRLTGRPPTSSIYLSGATRSIVHYRDLPELDAAYFTELDLAAYDWLHFEGRNVPALVRMLAYVRAKFPGLPVSLELEKPRDGLEDLFGQADVLLCSRGLARHYGFMEAQAFLGWMQGQAPRSTVVAAWGDAGAYGLAPGGQACHAPALVPVRVMDTLGAGDTFNAGIIDAGIREMPLQRMLTDACQLAGRKCGAEGYMF
ncbi:MAG TPA: PfkB family carbohydrate kinase [Methylophilaceae bacterium]|nr:PfkB family carbohydrate kinase [Methylophilaceae bacterium]